MSNRRRAKPRRLAVTTAADAAVAPSPAQVPVPEAAVVAPEPMPLWQAIRAQEAVRALRGNLSYGEDRPPTRAEIRQSAVASMNERHRRRFIEIMDEQERERQAEAIGCWLALSWPQPEET